MTYQSMEPLPLQRIAKRINEIARDHGFYADNEGNEVKRNFGEVIALMHSELSEALEEHRSGNPLVYFAHDHDREGEGIDWVSGPEGFPCENCLPKPEGAAIEMIDCVIRVLDTLYEMLKGTDMTIDDVIQIKMAFNANRPYKHGRAY